MHLLRNDTASDQAWAAGFGDDDGAGAGLGFAFCFGLGCAAAATIRSSSRRSSSDSSGSTVLNTAPINISPYETNISAREEGRGAGQTTPRHQETVVAQRGSQREEGNSDPSVQPLRNTAREWVMAVRCRSEA